MRRLVVLLAAALATALPAHGGQLLEPADYLKILTDSKLRYNILSEPARTPVEVMRCPRRDLSTRLVTKKNGERSLVEWKVKPEAAKLMDEGEALFQDKKMAEAGEKYKAAIAADPEAASAYYFYGDTLLFGARDAAGALAQYQKGIVLDPSMPSGHYFASTALVHLDRHADAREELVQALTALPAYDAILNAGGHSAEFWKIKPIVRHKFEPPAGYLGAKGTPNSIDVFLGPKGEWLGYAVCKAVWANEAAFRKRHTEGWSLEEERACVLSQLMSRMNKYIIIGAE